MLSWLNIVGTVHIWSAWQKNKIKDKNILKRLSLTAAILTESHILLLADISHVVTAQVSVLIRLDSLYVS